MNHDPRSAVQVSYLENSDEYSERGARRARRELALTPVTTPQREERAVRDENWH
jgi:hypothetical protein